jgi:hypothetical protein
LAAKVLPTANQVGLNVSKMALEPKDALTLVVSGLALIVSLITFYFSHLHKPSSALLAFLSRDYSGDRLKDGKVVEKGKRFLYYTLSNTGKQSLYIKEIELLKGPSPLGHLRFPGSFMVLESSRVESFVLAPGEVFPFTISSEHLSKKRSQTDSLNDEFEIISVEIISADGNRYQMSHNITNLPVHGLDLDDPIFDGVTLGRPVRLGGYV